MKTQIENALREQGVNEAETNTKFYCINILTPAINLVKEKYSKFSVWFWRRNYGLEMNRQDHAADGHLWRQIGACLVLIVYKAVGRVMR